jgi:group I intron endonuclease
MPNYQEGKIYKIYNTINDDIYVGSTTLKLCERMRDHRKCVNDEAKQHFFIYKAFRELGVENFFIELIEKCPCNDKDELRKKEGEWIRELKPSMNKNIAGRTINEYRIDNKEYIQEQNKQYRENNKEYIKEHNKQYYDINKEKVLEPIKCECGCVVKRGSLLRHKRTKKHTNLMSNTRYEQSVKCECGCLTTKPNLSRHMKSKKHIELMIKLN